MQNSTVTHATLYWNDVCVSIYPYKKSSIEIKGTNSGARLPAFESWLCDLGRITLCLSSLACKMRIIITYLIGSHRIKQFLSVFVKYSEQSLPPSKCDITISLKIDTMPCPCLLSLKLMTFTLVQTKGLVPKLSQLQRRWRRGDGYLTSLKEEKISAEHAAWLEWDVP